MNRSTSAIQNGTSSNNMSTLSDRFPYASTPAVSPVLNNVDATQQIQMQKANMKLPVGSLAPTCAEQIGYHGGGKIIDGFGVSRRNVTVRPRYLEVHDSTSASISPIHANESTNNQIKFTEPRGGRQLFAGGGGRGDQAMTCDNLKNYVVSREASFATASISCTEDVGCAQSDSGNSSSVSKSVFPYPTVSVGERFDSGEMLCTSLRILSGLRDVESERQRLFGNKRKEKAEDKVVPYVFVDDTFNAVNSEAAIHALYLLFSSLNVKETEQKFRDCWPVFEKKLEGIFRRVALEWLKEIIEANPGFFRGIRVEALGGLLVNPGGERFIYMMGHFCQFVMYTVANRMKGSVKQQVLLPPVPSPDPEITNRQLHLLKSRTQELQDRVVNNYNNTLHTEIVVTQRLKNADEFILNINRTESMQAARLKSCIINYSHVFGTPTEEQLKAREAVLLNVKIHSLVEDEPYEDFLRDRLEAHLERVAQDVYKPVSLLQDVMEDYQSIWQILEMDKNKSAVLDCTKMLPYHLYDETGGPSLDLFFNILFSSIDTIISGKYLNDKTPQDLLKDYQATILRLNYLNLLENKINEGTVDQTTIRSVVTNHRDILKLRVGRYDYDWSVLSKIQDGKIGKLLDMSPPRLFDINRVTGHTPGINTFLDSSSSSSSGRGDHVAFKRKRHINKLLPRPPKRPVSKDTRDSAISMSLNHLKSNGIYSKSYGSDLYLTPVSSQASSSRCISLQRNVVSPSYTKKFVPFDNTVASEATLEESSINISNRMSTSSVSTPTIQQNVIQSPSVDILSLSVMNTSVGNTSHMSTTSDVEIPLGLDMSTQERVSRLLDSVAQNNRSSLSPSVVHVQDSSDVVIKRSDRESVGVNLNELEGTKPDLVEDFGNISIIEDWEDTKGIMEMSHIEMFRNSDSDE